MQTWQPRAADSHLWGFQATRRLALARAGDRPQQRLATTCAADEQPTVTGYCTAAHLGCVALEPQIARATPELQLDCWRERVAEHRDCCECAIVHVTQPSWPTGLYPKEAST